MVVTIPNDQVPGTDAYQALPDSADAQPKIGRRRSSGVLSTFMDFLTQEITPNIAECPQKSGLTKVPSYDLLHRNTTFHNTESSEELPNQLSVIEALLKPLEPGSERTCVLTLVATALGSGVLALPHAFSLVGVGVGIVCLTLAACLSCVSLTILMVASRYTEAKSYAGLLTLATGSSRTGLLLDACLVCYGCAAILALLIFEGDFVPAILDALGIANPGRTWSIIAVSAAAWPLVLPPKVSALRYVAAFSPFAILYVAGNVVVQAPVFYEERPVDSNVVLYVMAPAQMLQASSIFVFSVMCHANAVPVAHMLDRPSVFRIVKVATYCNSCCWALYILIGVGGYLSFQAFVQGDFLLNYPVDSTSILCCRVMMAAVCYVGVPMNSAACVQALQKMLTAAIQRNPEPHVEERPFLFAVLATAVLAASTVGAVFLKDVAKVIGIVGGSLTTLQMFWLPALIYYRLLYPTQPKFFRKVVMSSMIVAGITGFASVAATLLF